MVLWYRDRGAIFGLKGPNAELPTGQETSWGSEFTGLSGNSNRNVAVQNVFHKLVQDRKIFNIQLEVTIL